MILGIDVSTYFEEEAVGAKYYHNGKEIDPLKQFINQGVNYMRIRVWNNPYSLDGKPYLGGSCDEDNFIKLAKKAQEYGYHIILDLHYSDFWADPNKQTCPKEWQGLEFEKIVQNVENFTKKVLIHAKNENINVEYIQIGNETTHGMIWPYGRLDYSVKPHGNFDKLTTLFKAGIKGAKEIFPEIKTIIHLERSFDQAVYYEYFDQLRKYNVEFDVIGMSYYPYWHGNFDEFFANVNMCKKEFHKDVMVMELGYGFTLEDYLLTNNGVNHMVINEESAKEFIDKLPYPISKEGQGKFIKRFLELCRENEVLGVNYWEPLWIPGNGICWASKEGQEYINEVGKSTRNEWANQCFFDYEGRANPAFDEYKQ